MMSKLDEKLQQLYQQSKTEHPMPQQLKQQLLQLTSKPKAKNWKSLWPAMQGLAACVALIWLAQQLWWQPAYYQIVLQSDTTYHQVQVHSLAKNETLPQQTAYQQRYQQYQHARQQLEHSNSLVGQLRFTDQQWQIEVCDQLLVKIDQQLALELQQDQPWLAGQWVELKTGQQGQILAVQSGKQPLHCSS
jgi:hypothetical protein